MSYNKRGYRVRAKLMQEITDKHYEPENQAKSKKMVWKQYIYPYFGVCYNSYLRYLGEEVEEENKTEDKRQLRLF
jgi:hypothetical protein